MKTRWKWVILAASVVVVALSVTGVALATSTGEDADTSTASAEAVPLSHHVERHLVVLCEEAKLARDVYDVFYDTWGVAAFDNISRVENRHMIAVQKLLERHGIEDPVGDNPPGVFTNEKIQAAYTELIARGTSSLESAYKGAIVIERTEIALLKDLLGDTNRPDVTLVARNVLVDSQNHLVIFTRLLNK